MASLSGSNSLWYGTFAARHLPKITIVDISLSHANLALTREQMSAMIGRCPGGGGDCTLAWQSQQMSAMTVEIRYCQ